jgi:predicted ATP-grasp superfamily ATP-dependent carboligase
MKKDRPFSGKHVLILEGYCKQVLPFIRGFKDLGCEVSVLCGSRLDCGYASRLPDHKILGVCDLHKPEESEEYIVKLVKSGIYDMVFAPFDFSARILSHNKEELSKYSIIYANDSIVFDRANNKEEVMRVCMENDIPCPQTFFSVKHIEDINNKIQFPVIIKPHSMYGARGFHLFHSADEMSEYVISKGIDLKDYVIQEYIPAGSRVMGANIMVDRNGNVKSSYLYICEHLYPEEGGTSTLNAILVRPDISAECERLVKLMGLHGEIGVDLMLDCRDNMGKVIEINPRPVHGIALGFYAGVNHAQQILEDAFGKEVTSMDIVKPKTASRIGQTDMLWFLSSKDRFRRLSWQLGYKPVKEQMFYWDDPAPWFAFLFQGIKDFKKKMKEKKQ